MVLSHRAITYATTVITRPVVIPPICFSVLHRITRETEIVSGDMGRIQNLGRFYEGNAPPMHGYVIRRCEKYAFYGQ